MPYYIQRVRDVRMTIEKRRAIKRKATSTRAKLQNGTPKNTYKLNSVWSVLYLKVSLDE